MSEERRFKRRRLFIIALMIVGIIVIAVAALLLDQRAIQSSSTSSSTNTGSISATTPTTTTSSANTSSADYAYFIAPNTARIESIREWFMSAPDMANQKPGYDPAFELVRGGNWPGYGNFPSGWHPGFVLIDSNLLLGRSLDYLNAQKGIKTNIDSTVRNWLSNTTFVDPVTGQQAKYQGDDRREIFFGKAVDCVKDSTGQTYYVPGHTLSDPNPITTAIPTSCVSGNGLAMEELAPSIELDYLKGNLQTAQQAFVATLAGWTPTAGTGSGGSTGGYFNDVLDHPPCKSPRVLSTWIHMARATGFWDTNNQTRTIAQEVENQLWAAQNSDGGIGTAYKAPGSTKGCTGIRATPESTGDVLLAFDPRVPQWFKSSAAGTFDPRALSIAYASLFDLVASPALVIILFQPRSFGFPLACQRLKLIARNITSSTVLSTNGHTYL